MSDYENENPNQEEFQDEPSSHSPDWNRWWLVAVLMLFAATGASMIYAIRQHGAAEQLAQSNGQMAASLRQTQAQIASLSDQLNALQAQTAAQAPAAAAPIVQQQPARHRAIRRSRHHASNSRYSALQRRLAQQQQQISATQQAVAQTRSDLENSLASAQDGLNSAIAHNHAELVALERKGERSYYEFSISKSKHFQREGPISISLRHANTKHKNYNLVLLVDDMQLSKKNVNLYEPLVLQPQGASQPLEIVVNRIDKNQIQGYVSAPKYNDLQASMNSSPAKPGNQPQTGTNATPGSAQAAGAPAPNLQHRAGTD